MSKDNINRVLLSQLVNKFKLLEALTEDEWMELLMNKQYTLSKLYEGAVIRLEIDPRYVAQFENEEIALNTLAGLVKFTVI